MKLLCIRGNAWARAGNHYPVISETAYVYQVALDGGMAAWVHKAQLCYVATGGKAEFEVMS